MGSLQDCQDSRLSRGRTEGRAEVSDEIATVVQDLKVGAGRPDEGRTECASSTPSEVALQVKKLLSLIRACMIHAVNQTDCIVEIPVKTTWEDPIYVSPGSPSAFVW